ncbi:MAG: cryptochrome/photolyase family protein [Candidatus Nanopelagicaceae bacterium]
MKRNIMWFRRDLRLGDNPALLAAIANSDEIVPLFILDPNLIKQAGSKRLAYLANSLRALDQSLDGRLHIVAGDQVEVLKSYQAAEVHISEEFEPYGAARDKKVAAAGVNLIRTGNPYAVAPGRVRKPDDTNYRVYTPFYKGWLAHGWRGPVAAPKVINALLPTKSQKEFPDWQTDCEIPEAGEAAALKRFEWFKKNALDSYDEQRNMAGIDGTSKLSAHLKFGEIHPRTLLKDLGLSKAHDTFRKEIAWREFYADVLFHNPNTIDEYYIEKFSKMRYDEPGEKFKAWCEGRTGYPFVDAAMRQLVQTGWMHNRTRMVVASFLVKDLHIEWQHGANFFMEHLVDFDPASNSHGWQWTAGCGTDASPYYRVFNPIEQGRKFDPEGSYIRKFVPELASVPTELIHEPGLSYIEPIVDHKVERVEALARLEEIKG